MQRQQDEGEIHHANGGEQRRGPQKGYSSWEPVPIDENFAPKDAASPMPMPLPLRMSLSLNLPLPSCSPRVRLGLLEAVCGVVVRSSYGQIVV